MSQHTAHTTPTNGPGYETADVHVGPITKFMVGLVFLMVLGAILGGLSFYVLKIYTQDDRTKLQITTMQEKRVLPPEPRLQVSNHDDLLTFRAKEAGEVSGHATWLENGKNAKLVRLPIDRAIELISERGLPVFKSEAAPAAAAAEGKK